MLQDIRNSTKSIFIKLLLGLIALSFVMFYGYETTSSCSPPAVAKVNGVLIMESEFISQMQAQIENYRRLLKRDLDPSMLSFVQQSVVDNLINRVLLSDEARRLGIHVGDKAVRDELERRFTDPKTNKFSHDYYRNYVMRFLRTTPKKYESRVRLELMASRLQQFIEASAKVSEEEVRQNYIFQNRQVNFEFLKMAPNSVVVKENPDDKTLREYYETHPSDFQSEESRSIEYAVFNAKEFGEKTDKAAVDQRLQDEANKLVATLKAKRDQLMQESIGDLRAAYGKTAKAFTRADNLPALPDSGVLVNRAFSLKKGEVSEPIKGFVSGNYYVMRVMEIEPAKPLPFEEAKSSVLVNYIESQKGLKAEQLVDEALAGLKKGEPIEKVAASFDMESGETGLFNEGTSRNIPNVGFSADIGKELFALSVGGDSKSKTLGRSVKVAGNYFVFRAKAEKRPTDAEVNDALPQEMKTALNQKQQSLVSDWVKTLRERADNSGNVTLYNQQGETS